MSDRKSPDSTIHVVAQAAGAVVSADYAARAAALAASEVRQDAALSSALREVSKVREFVDTPGGILGNEKTKHGEIAEFVEVTIRRARQVLEGSAPTAWKDGLPRTGPTDYVIDGVDVQSKFINGVARNLDHVIEHMEKYPKFGRDGSYYHIPRDHFDIIQKAMRGDSHDGLSQRSLETIARKAEQIRALSGQENFDVVVRPGVSNYADVQQGRVHSTLDAHDDALRGRDQEIRARHASEHGPSIAGAANAAITGAAVGGAVRLATSVWSKHKQGKRLLRGDYTAADWKDLGLEVVQGGLQGGISAAAIYGLTNFAGMAAPFAGAFVSSAAAVADLTRKYHAGVISLDEFCELGQVACLEGAVVGVAAAAGQALIPIPILGATIGAFAGRLLASLTRDLLDRDSKTVAARLSAEYEKCIAALDTRFKIFIKDIEDRYERMGTLASLAFDRAMNAQQAFSASVTLGRAYGVAPGDLLKTPADIDSFFLS